MMANISPGNFISWWSRGLSYLVPSSLRRLFQSLPDRNTIEMTDGKVFLRHYTGASSVPDAKQEFDMDETLQKSSVSQWLRKHNDHDTEIMLLVSEQLVLRKNLSLPLAARANLRQVLGFEIERKTPFNPDQAYFDFTITSQDKITNRLNLSIIIAPRNRVDPQLETLGNWGITVDAIRPVQDDIPGGKINLLAPDARPEQEGDTNTLTSLLVCTAFILLLAVLYLPLKTLEEIAGKLESEVTLSRQSALELQSLKEERDTLLEHLNFLAHKRNSEVSSVELLNEITHIIPDDTWLTRLVIKDDEVQLQGESDNASQLIQKIESSAVFSDVEFRSPVTQNNATKKEKFYISAKFSGQKDTG